MPVLTAPVERAEDMQSTMIVERVVRDDTDELAKDDEVDVAVNRTFARRRPQPLLIDFRQSPDGLWQYAWLKRSANGE